MYLNVEQLRALFKALGFQYRGTSCSFFEFLKASKDFIQGISFFDDVEVSLPKCNVSSYFIEPKSLIRMVLSNEVNLQSVDRNSKDIIKQLKDIFYSVKKPISEIFTEALTNGKTSMDKDSFLKCLKKYSRGSFKDSELSTLFQHVAFDSDRIEQDRFEKFFKIEKPTKDCAVPLLKKIRDWQYNKGLSSEQSFERLLKVKDNSHLDPTINRIEFHKCIRKEGIDFSAAEVDFIFNLIETKKKDKISV
jgi:Ca2+-binding EF-hand superfamily protein